MFVVRGVDNISWKVFNKMLELEWNECVKNLIKALSMSIDLDWWNQTYNWAKTLTMDDKIGCMLN
jgi:hypothetical protein